MAVRLVSNEVSDLCIGKPAVRSLPPAAVTVGDVLAALRKGDEPHLAVQVVDLTAPEKRTISGKLCVADVVCYLCSDGNFASPAVALERPISALLPKGGGGLVRRVEPQFSILEALDLILDGAQSLVVPIRAVGRKKVLHGGVGGAVADFCWLTHEDFVRYFLNSIAHFCPIPTLSIDALGLVRSADALTVRHEERGLVLLPLIRRALSDQTAVAVVANDGRLLGEISPASLCACDETVAVAAGIATLNVGDLMSFIDHYGSPPDSLVRLVKSRLKEKGLKEMLELMEDELSALSSYSSASSSSSSSSDDELGGKQLRRLRSKCLSLGRRAEEPEVCHPGSSLVAAMVQALAHRVSYLWVVDEDDYSLMGIVTFADMLSMFSEQLICSP